MKWSCDFSKFNEIRNDCNKAPAVEKKTWLSCLETQVLFWVESSCKISRFNSHMWAQLYWKIGLRSSSEDSSGFTFGLGVWELRFDSGWNQVAIFPGSILQYGFSFIEKERFQQDLGKDLECEWFFEGHQVFNTQPWCFQASVWFWVE